MIRVLVEFLRGCEGEEPPKRKSQMCETFCIASLEEAALATKSITFTLHIWHDAMSLTRPMKSSEQRLFVRVWPLANGEN